MFHVDKKSLERLQRDLAKKFPREFAKEGRKVIRRAATDLRKKVQQAAPVDEGDLRRSIYVKVLREKVADPIAADVRVRTGKKNAAKNRDGFYWRFIEYGTVKMPARPFVAPTLERFRLQLKRYFDEYVDMTTKKLNRAD